MKDVAQPPAVTKIAYSRNGNTESAVKVCLHQLRNSRALLLVVFCGGKHDAALVLDRTGIAFPGVPVVGGAAAGAIAREGFGITGLEIAMLAFLEPATTPSIIVGGDLRDGEHQAGVALGHRIAAASEDGALVILFYDSVAQQTPLRLHPASAIVAGMAEGLGERRVKVVGSGMLTDMNITGGWVYTGTSVMAHGVVALVFPAGVTADIVVLHGCRPVSGFMTITRIEGATVFELDGKPALPVLEEMLQIPVGTSTTQDLVLGATLGQKYGDRYAAFDENNYVNRLILGSDRAAGSITMFEQDFQLGDHVQVMSRDNTLMLQSAYDGVGALNATIQAANADPAADKPICCLYIDCAGRASPMSGATFEEADIVRQEIDRSVPFIGFYSGVEIAPFDGSARALDWTGVLAVLRGPRG